MNTKDYANQIKVIFSMISMLLMLPLINNEQADNYFRTVFIFLINRVIDMVMKNEECSVPFFEIWGMVNQWLGALASALAFCSIDESFRNMIGDYKSLISIFLFVIVLSCVIQEICVIFLEVKENKKVVLRIKQNKKNRKEIERNC